MKIEIEFSPDGKGRIAVDCPHVENGVCSACLEPLLLEAVKGRNAVRVLESLDKVMVLQQQATAELRKWIKGVGGLEWKVADAEPAAPHGDEG